MGLGKYETSSILGCILVSLFHTNAFLLFKNNLDLVSDKHREDSNFVCFPELFKLD